MWHRVYPLRSELEVILALLGLAALAWWSTDARMAGMDAGPWTDQGALPMPS